MVVRDHDDSRELICGLLAYDGSVSEARTALEAAAIAGAARVDVVVTDIMRVDVLARLHPDALVAMPLARGPACSSGGSTRAGPRSHALHSRLDRAPPQRSVQAPMGRHRLRRRISHCEPHATYRKHRVLIGAPKSGKARRVDLPAALVARLRARQSVLEADAALQVVTYRRGYSRRQRTPTNRSTGRSSASRSGTAFCDVPGFALSVSTICGIPTRACCLPPANR